MDDREKHEAILTAVRETVTAVIEKRLPEIIERIYERFKLEYVKVKGAGA